MYIWEMYTEQKTVCTFYISHHLNNLEKAEQSHKTPTRNRHCVKSVCLFFFKWSSKLYADCNIIKSVLVCLLHLTFSNSKLRHINKSQEYLKSNQLVYVQGKISFKSESKRSLFHFLLQQTSFQKYVTHFCLYHK